MNRGLSRISFSRLNELKLGKIQVQLDFPILHFFIGSTFFLLYFTGMFLKNNDRNYMDVTFNAILQITFLIFTCVFTYLFYNPKRKYSKYYSDFMAGSIIAMFTLWNIYDRQNQNYTINQLVPGDTNNLIEVAKTIERGEIPSYPFLQPMLNVFISKIGQISLDDSYVMTTIVFTTLSLTLIWVLYRILFPQYALFVMTIVVFFLSTYNVPYKFFHFATFIPALSYFLFNLVIFQPKTKKQNIKFGSYINFPIVMSILTLSIFSYYATLFFGFLGIFAFLYLIRSNLRMNLKNFTKDRKTIVVISFFSLINIYYVLWPYLKNVVVRKVSENRFILFDDSYFEDPDVQIPPISNFLVFREWELKYYILFIGLIFAFWFFKKSSIESKLFVQLNSLIILSSLFVATLLASRMTRTGLVELWPRNQIINLTSLVFISVFGYIELYKYLIINKKLKLFNSRFFTNFLVSSALAVALFDMSR